MVYLVELYIWPPSTSYYLDNTVHHSSIFVYGFVLKMLSVGKCFSPGTLKMHTSAHAVRGRSTLDVERQFRNGSIRKLKREMPGKLKSKLELKWNKWTHMPLKCTQMTKQASIVMHIFAFDEGRTLPNLLGCLLSRRFPVYASESWPVFFRSMVYLFGAILNDVTISLRKAFCLVLRSLSDVLEGSSFIILDLRRASLFVGCVGRFQLYWQNGICQTVHECLHYM